MPFIRPGRGALPITGLEWAGAEADKTRRVLTFNGTSSAAPPAMYDMTYVFKVYPKGPKNGGATFRNYWTIFFWGNYGVFDSSKNYIGCHPYPFDDNDQTTGQNWEISIANNSLVGDDYAEADATGDSNLDAATGVWGAGGPPSETNNGASATWNRWYTCVIRCFRVDSTTTRNQFIFDWDLFVNSSGASGWFQHTVTNASWGFSANNPPTPSICIGQPGPNAGDTDGWGDNGREEWKGIIRGVQIYDGLVGTTAYKPTLANLADVASELANPGSVRTPWYLNLNPTPDDVTDKSGSGHHPWFPTGGQKPTLWTGP